ncbi:hypothetical protein FJ973_06515 [Mesorhizobium sp. B2-1-3]|uniref:hypothetical protein n=1 Tax=Mesorhizobium sp. B2-1-3 TaxID=2589972 RepID=UPI00112A9858|nr:hypothetical protein [Mesorhizobium sp. B2-1-3]TPN16334.1 hypothetical protein FJ973_06515 [Mesorhizobium sp. B2-1-3]
MLTRRQRDMVAAILRSVIDEVVSEHFEAATQEHQVTSRIAALLEKELRNKAVLNRRVRVVTQELPDKGRGSLEKPTGIDLYIGIMDFAEDGFSKGIFVQAKWREVYRSPREMVGLHRQCRRMLRHSDDSYVWLYGPEGVDAVRATEVVQQPNTRPEQLLSRKTDDIFRRMMECTEGDPDWGLDRVMVLGDQQRRAMGKILEELRIRTAIGVIIDGRYEMEMRELE